MEKADSQDTPITVLMVGAGTVLIYMRDPSSHSQQHPQQGFCEWPHEATEEFKGLKRGYRDQADCCPLHLRGGYSLLGEKKC